MDYYARAYPIFSWIKGWRRMQGMLASLQRFDRNEVAKQRHKIIHFYDQYGEAATKEAFGADRKVIHVWKKKLEQSGGRLEALVPVSTKPYKVRTMSVDTRIIDFIRSYRRKYGRIGKEKLKPLLDAYCKEIGIPTISESKIGKIIKRNKFFYQGSPGRIYHNPDAKHPEKRKRQRVKKSPKPIEPGHILADSTVVHRDGVTRYLISAIDVMTKFALTGCYKSLSSRTATDFLKRLMLVSPLPLLSIQSDSGSEFLGDFDKELQKHNIPHYFSYPRCPKINSFIERYNRTIKEEFVRQNLDAIQDIDLFRTRLAEYLIFYNCVRPHKSLNKKAPVQSLIEKGVMSKMFATSTAD
jgi:transposase InsO family protein